MASDFHNLTLLVPRPWFAPYVPNLRSLNGLVMDRREPVTELLAAHLLALAARAALLTAREAVAAARGTVALITALLSSDSEISQRDPGPTITSIFRNVCAYIDQHLAAKNLQPEAIAAEFGMSRATLYRLFEPVGDRSRLCLSTSVRRGFAKAGIPAPHLPAKVDSIRTIVHLVAAGIGLALVPRLAIADTLCADSLVEIPARLMMSYSGCGTWRRRWRI